MQVILKALVLPNSTEYSRCRDAITGRVNTAGVLILGQSNAKAGDTRSRKLKIARY